MAWAYGNKTFTVSWKSLKERTCRIDIYIRGSQAPVAFQLTPAAKPFIYEDDADSDLLENVIRYKTGYVSIIEDENQSIRYLYPTDDFSHYVEFYYDGVLNFVGFLQAQDFSNDWAPLPCERQFAVASPLWALSSRKFSFDGNIKNPQFVTIGSLLKEIMSYNSIYQYVIFPYFEDLKLDNTIWSQTFAPWNEDFNHVQTSTTQNPVYEVKTYEWFLDALCKAFGWVLHDDVDTLTFAMFDYKGRYARYPVAHVGEPAYLDIVNGPQGGVSTNLTAKMEYADNAASENLLMPYSRIRIEYEGDYESKAEVSYLRTYNLGFAQSDDVIHAVGLQPRLTQREIYPQGTSIAFDDARKITSRGVHVAVFTTSNNKSKQTGICYAIKGNESNNYELFRVRIYTPYPQATWRCKYTLTSGATLNTLSADDTYHRFGRVDNNVYYIGDSYVECAFIVRQVPNYLDPFTGQWSSVWQARDVMFFSDIEFYMESEENFEEYLTLTKGYDEISGYNTAFDDAELTMPLHMYRKNDHQIGTEIRETKFTEYPYLLSVRNELIARFRLVNNMPEHIWCKLWSYISKKWRVIGYTFDPTDDEVELTIERNQILES